MRLGVYGTLKSKGRLNPIMLQHEATFLGESTFQGDLYSLGSFPAAVEGTGTVVCEVWECSDELVARLDSIEGHPWHYRRSRVWTPNFGEVQAYIYQRKLHSFDRPIASGNWLADQG
jgi:gamma-glutamylcyclotransferase (GGCT)/AIG2-like uncharacterized protein YtfP